MNEEDTKRLGEIKARRLRMTQLPPLDVDWLIAQLEAAQAREREAYARGVAYWQAYADAVAEVTKAIAALKPGDGK